MSAQLHNENARAADERRLGNPAVARHMNGALPQLAATIGKTPVLNGQERDDLVRAIETAMGITEQRRFALWAQGPLQALLPHQIEHDTGAPLGRLGIGGW